MTKKVVLGLSGGVDSAVAAYLLKQQGYEVIGVFLRTWNDEDLSCPAAMDVSDARAVAGQLGISFFVFDAKKEYWDDIYQVFKAQHQQNRTPNVDLLCNKFVKFGVLWNYARQLGADYLATGHYAKLENGNLTKPKDSNKDQTYFLAFTEQEKLKNVLFPLADLTKKQIRQIAREQKLVNAEKKDSVGICMVGDRDYKTFVAAFMPSKKGDIVDFETQKVLGRHDGLTFYTLGQRKGLHVGGVKGAPDAPWFVVGKKEEKNQLIVSQDEEILKKQNLKGINPNWIGFDPPKVFAATAKVRYRSPESPCVVSVLNDKEIEVRFEAPERSPTPGQAVVFYDGDICLGGAEIDAVW